MKNALRFPILIVFILLISCGDEKKEEEKITVGGTGSVPPAKEAVDSIERAKGPDSSSVGSEFNGQDRDTVQVMLTANDQMQFDKEEIRVQEGQVVKLTLKHVGQLDENIMGHNFVLLKKNTNVAQFAMEASEAKDNDYIPDGGDQVIAHTDMLGGGESTTIEFKAPRAGEYTFICSFPGHYVQMQGQFIVEKAS